MGNCFVEAAFRRACLSSQCWEKAAGLKAAATKANGGKPPDSEGAGYAIVAEIS